MSWVTRVWSARACGLLNGEEAWQVLLEAREAPDPALVVDGVLRGLAAAYCVSPADAELIVIEDMSAEPDTWCVCNP